MACVFLIIWVKKIIYAIFSPKDSNKIKNEELKMRNFLACSRQFIELISGCYRLLVDIKGVDIR